MPRLITHRIEESIEEILTQLTLPGQTSGIILLSCTNPDIVSRVEEELQRRLRPRPTFRLDIDREIFTRLEKLLKEHERPVVFLHGLPEIIKKEKETSPISHTLDAFNWQREFFVENPITALFWIDDTTVEEIIRNAKDFWKFRTGPYYLKSDADIEREIYERLRLREEKGEFRLEDVNSKIQLITQILQPLEETRPLDVYSILPLEINLARLLSQKGEREQALKLLSRSLGSIETYVKEKTLTGEEERATLRLKAEVLLAQGDVLSELSRYNEALETFKLAREITDSLKDKRLSASLDLSTATVLRMLGRLEEA
ncbi:MAG: hypothetical protein ACK4WF_04065, partial [Candidatus Brocadiales bacterium]